jgi:pimeloyl-ACP methyl ester carboxylesterase
MAKELPLVLLHGYPFNNSMWQKVISRLSPELRVIALDLPGFGREPVLNVEPSIDAMADHIARLLDREQIDKALVAGFSMGGYVALALTERRRTRVAGLALINSQPFADSDEVRAGRRTMVERVRKEGPQAAVAAALPKLFAPARANDPGLRAYAEDGARLAGVPGITWALEAMARRPDRTAAAAPVSLLILHSALDLFIPVERIRNFASSLPQAVYVELPDAGHATPLEEPDAVASALSNWVAKVERS